MLNIEWDVICFTCIFQDEVNDGEKTSKISIRIQYNSAFTFNVITNEITFKILFDIFKY